MVCKLHFNLFPAKHRAHALTNLPSPTHPIQLLFASSPRSLVRSKGNDTILQRATNMLYYWVKEPAAGLGWM